MQRHCARVAGIVAAQEPCRELCDLILGDEDILVAVSVKRLARPLYIVPCRHQHGGRWKGEPLISGAELDGDRQPAAGRVTGESDALCRDTLLLEQPPVGA